MHIAPQSWMPAAGLACLALAGCSGGGGTAGSQPGTSGDFVVLRTTPPNNGKLFLNEAIEIDFSNPVDLGSADLNTFSFTVFDLNGNAVNEQPAGSFQLSRSAGDAKVGRRLVFAPRFPTNDTFDNGGFKPGRRYVVQLVGGEARNRTVLSDASGRPLAKPLSFEFRTADGTTPAQLFSDTKAGGPRRAGFAISPAPDRDGVVLNKFGQLGVELRLQFDQPLNPNSANVPVRVSADPLERDLSNRGRMFLEYDDSVNGRSVWIPATVDIEINTRQGSEIVLRPVGVLPNNAEVRVIVENTVEDMSGESNVADASYNRMFATFRTRSDFEPQYDAVVDRFDADNFVDDDAAFLEPRAVVESGRLAASFNFDGRESRLIFRPSDREVELNTNFTTIVPAGGSPINVSGGVFNFKEVEIPEGVLVRGSGTNPMVFLVSGDFTVNGHLAVDGGLGARVDTLNSANFPTGGGIGVCGGGTGGKGSPNGADRSLRGEDGFGAGQRPSGGGEGGRLSCTRDCNRGSAGGGGSLGTKGDPYYPPNSSQIWPQVTGRGGQGCLNRSLRGGAAGPQPFGDSRDDNDFWGSGVNNNKILGPVRIRGELLAPLAGSGGGGGGDRSSRCNTGDAGFVSDNKGGGGGGGAGVLIVQALGKIKIGRRGKISADGGDGGGGEQAGGNNQGGGGGGGSGGMVILMSGQGIDIEVHGRDPNDDATYGELDYDFAISADGGIGTQGRFGGSPINGKYPPGNTTWNAKPAGGFGGLGIVQLMVPPGDDQEDNGAGREPGTGNSLDDNITFFFIDANGQRQVVAPDRKKQLLAWRGWRDPERDEPGNGRDENDQQTNIAKNEGEIRPTPIMLPSPFGALSRARSLWIEMGSVAREATAQPPGPNTPRVVVVPSGQQAPKPDFEFAGTGRQAQGYLDFSPNGQPLYPPIRIDGQTDFAIANTSTNVTFQGQSAFQVELPAGRRLGPTDDRYTHYRLQFVGANQRVLGDLPILGHRNRFVFLEATRTLPTGAQRVRVIPKFFEVTTDGQPGLGDTFERDNARIPISNVRVGFAFHTDPNDGLDGRYPDPTNPATLDQTLAFDLSVQSFQDYLDGTGEFSYSTPHRPTFVQYDVLFNTRFDPAAANNNSGRPLTAASPDIGIEDLRLPYRF